MRRRLLNDRSVAQKYVARNPSTLLACFFGFIALAITRSLLFVIPLTLVSFFIPRIVMRRRSERERIELSELWPEIIDHIISGLHSGLSLAETLVGLSERGPLATRYTFASCGVALREGRDFHEVFLIIKKRFHDGLADQVCEVLDFARGTGSRDTSIILRSLGDFIRSDIALRADIRAKHGWIKNSALIAAAAPWILLLILSSQHNTVQAFSTPGGIVVLLIGVGLSAIAYVWMERAGKLPQVPRIFA